MQQNVQTRSANSTAGWIDLARPLVEWSEAWRLRDLLLQLVKRNVQTRYKGSVLGLLWVVTTPLLMLAVYTFIFGVILKTRWGVGTNDSMAAFALILFCGQVVLNIFSETLTMAVGTVVNNPNYVKKVVFPLEILPLASFLTALFFGMVWFGILLLSIVACLHIATWTMVALPLVLLPLFFLTCGLAWMVAALGVYIRDLAHVIGILLQMLFFMTPVIYQLDMVPERYRVYLWLNPLTYVVENVRKVLIYGQWPNWSAWAAMLLGSIIISKLGYLWFMKSKRGFGDVL